MSRSLLSVRQKFCVELAVYLTLFNLAALSRTLRKGILNVSLPREFAAEIFVHLSLIVGFPAMLEGLAQLQAIAPGDPGQRAQKTNLKWGNVIFKKIYGAQSAKLLINLRAMLPELPDWIVRDTYGKVFARKGLSLQEREILNISVLATQGLEKQLFSHLRGALRLGLQPIQVRAVLREAERVSGKDLRASFALFRALTIR